MLKNVIDSTNEDFSGGLNTVSNFFKVKKNQSPNMMDIKVNFDGSIQKRLGSTTQNAVALAGGGTSGFSPDLSQALTDRLISMWKLDESSGQRDDSYDTTHLQSINSVIGTGGLIKNAALLIASSNQRLARATTATIETGDIDFSISSWFYLNSTGQFTILAKADSATGAEGINSNTVLMLHGDGSDGSTTIIDSSPSGHTMNTAGNVQVDTSQKKFGTGSLYFPTNPGSAITTPDSSDWNFGTGDFTWDFWFMTSASLGGGRYLLFWGDEADNTGIFASDVGVQVYLEGSAPTPPKFAETFFFSQNVFYHIALTRAGSTLRLFIDGNQMGSDLNDTTDVYTGDTLTVGGAFTHLGSDNMVGWMDEVRITKGVALWTSNFTPPTSAYAASQSASELEYRLWVNSDKRVQFDVSSSGLAFNGSAVASNFGAVSTSTWYHVVAWHDTGDNLGIAVNLTTNNQAYTSGVRAGSAGFSIGAFSDGSLAFNGRIDETAFWKRVLTQSDRLYLYNSGLGNTYTPAQSGESWGSFDFGASSTRWYTVAAGTGIFASSDLGINFTAIATGQNASWHNFERSKNVLVSTTDAYNTPLAWPGSAGTFATILNPSAPLARFSINFQGFLILMNTNARKRSFFYEDENSQLTGDWADSFDFPSTQDDEVTGAFILRNRLYVSTRYSIFRVSFIGGNPDWSFIKLKNFGFVPRTIKTLNYKDAGEVVVGMSWDRRIRLFDGSDDRIISDLVENPNGMCDFSMDNVSFAGSGLLNSFAETDDNEQVYKICVSLGANSTSTTHIINLDGRTGSFYPYQNQLFNTMAMAQSGGERFLLAVSRSGYVHLMDNGNLDVVTPVNDNFESAFLFDKSPSQLAKTYRNDLYFDNTSSGTIYYRDRIDYISSFTQRKQIILAETTNKVLIRDETDIRSFQGVYQFQITSSANSADPWVLTRFDFFSQGKGIGSNP